MRRKTENRRIRYALLAVVPLLLANTSGFEDLGALDAQISAMTGAAIGEPNGAVAPLDRRLKLRRCPEPVSIEGPQMGALAVRCQPLGWRIRVPLVKDRNLRSSQAMPYGGQAAEKMVRRGEAVELIVGDARYQVSTMAIAMEDGTRGKAIRVKTANGKMPTIATVIDRGMVKIN